MNSESNSTGTAKPKRRRRASPGGADRTTESPRTTGPRSLLSVVREWSDALVIAFLLAMFIRTFVVELFKIPSGSMMPTLIGTAEDYSRSPSEYVIEWDVSDPPDGEKDLVVDRLQSRYPRYQIFYRGKDGKFVRTEMRTSLRLPPEARRRARKRNDRIVVNKFIYWLRPPQRGEIVVFRVPPSIYEPDKPIYVKRVVGLPGDHVEIRQPHVYVNGEEIDQPEVFQRIEYVDRFGTTRSGSSEKRPAYIQWHVEREGYQEYECFDSAKVPDHHYFVLGDNSTSSRDSRDWGAFPENHLKGKAVFRYWPIDTIGFLD